MSYRDSAQEIINFADRGALASCINNGVEFLLGVETDDAGEGIYGLFQHSRLTSHYRRYIENECLLC